MFSHPDFIMMQAAERQRDLIADAERQRLLAAARRARKARRARRPAAGASGVGNLATCASPAVG